MKSIQSKNESAPAHDPSRAGPLLANTHALPWHSLGEGIEFQLLRYSEITGEWALYVRMQPGARIIPHHHLSAGEYFVTRGELKYDMGAAPAGVYGYESIGEVHKEARTDELTEFLFLGRGAVSYPDEGGNIQFILDWEFLKRVTEGEELEKVT